MVIQRSKISAELNWKIEHILSIEAAAEWFALLAGGRV